MMRFIQYIQEFNLISVLLRILLTVIAGGIIGNERGRHGSAAGFRTHILVCLGGSLTVLCSLYASKIIGLNGDVFRIAAQVVSGIGFLGAGIILVKNNITIAGLTTAAGMWVTAIIGVSFGYGFYVGGLLSTIICVINATLFTKLEHKKLQAMQYYVEVEGIKKAQSVLEQIETVVNKDAFIESMPAKSGIVGNVGFVVTIFQIDNSEKIKQALNEIEGIACVLPG